MKTAEGSMKVLLASCSAELRDHVLDVLSSSYGRIEIVQVESPPGMASALAERPPDLVLIESTPSSPETTSLIEQVQAATPCLIVVLLGSPGSDSPGSAQVRSEGVDYLPVAYLEMLPQVVARGRMLGALRQDLLDARRRLAMGEGAGAGRELPARDEAEVFRDSSNAVDRQAEARAAQAEQFQAQNEQLEELARQLEAARESQAASQVRAETLARELEGERALLEAILRQMPAGLVVAEAPSGKLLLSNERAAEILGCEIRADGVKDYGQYPAYHLSGRRYCPEEWPLVRAAQRGETVRDEEVQFERRDGSKRTLHLNASPVRDHLGHVRAGVVTFRDVTEDRQAQAEKEAALTQLRQSETRFRRLIEGNIIGVAYSDASGVVSEANDAALEILGYTRDELAAGQINWRSLTPPEYLAADDRAVAELRASGRFSPFEKQYIRKDGTRVPVMIGASVVDAVAGSWVCFVLELTALKRVEEDLRQARDELEMRVAERTADMRAANQALEESRQRLRALSRRQVEIQEAERRAISRELHDDAGQAMTSLKLGLGLLKREPDCTDALRERIDNLRELADGIMESLHRLALNLRPSSLDRYGLVPALEQSIAARQQQTGLQISFVAENMDGERLPGELETAIYRMVQEALTNVVRHARAEHAGVVLERIRDRVLLIVEDDGVGFDPEAAARRGRLGLIGLRERAEMLGGTLTIESSSDQGAAGEAATEWRGTTVYVELPIPASASDVPQELREACPALEVRSEVTASAGAEAIDRGMHHAVPAGGDAGCREMLPTQEEQPQEGTGLKLFTEESAAELVEANNSLERSREQLRLLASRVLSIQEEERADVARELFDDVGQLLTALTVGLGVFERRFHTSPEARAHVQYLKQTAEDIVARIHRVGSSLRPASLDRLGLVPAVRQYVEQFGQRYGIEVQVETVDFEGARLHPDAETGVYRILQEALANVAQHSQAQHVGLVITRREDQAMLLVLEDDGVGFNPSDATACSGLGLLAMEERARMLGGGLWIESNEGAGTTLFLEVPLS